MIERFLALGLAKDEPLPTVYPYPELVTSAASQAAAVEKLKLSLEPSPILALCPGAEFGPSKRWPEAAYAEVARAHLAAGGQVWLFGSAKDKAVTEEIMRLTQQGCVDLAGRTTLAEALDLLALTSAVISNDSGLMHVAAALKKPLVALYGSTSPAFTPPLAKAVSIQQLNLPCQPCFQRECPLKHHRCMQALTPASVLQALQNLRAS